MKYKHIFFDLDHTLWDTDTNSAEAVLELYHKYSLYELGIKSPAEFVAKYTEINDQFWDDYSKGRVSRQTLRYKRFLLLLQHFGIKNYDLSYSLSADYIDIAPHKTKVQPHTHEVLNYLEKKYSLHILTNGFNDAQHSKLKASGIEKNFQFVITAEKAGSKKPSVEIFDYAFKLTKATAAESILVGDNLEVDIIGARSVGMDQVYYNLNNRKHKEPVSHEIKSLKELMEIL